MKTWIKENDANKLFKLAQYLKKFTNEFGTVEFKFYGPDLAVKFRTVAGRELIDGLLMPNRLSD